jgi:hypothetical protein
MVGALPRGPDKAATVTNVKQNRLLLFLARNMLFIQLVLWGWGCLLSNPPDYDELGNRWPVVTHIDPQQLIVTVDLTDEESPRTPFTVKVWDADESDSISHRWFVDYQPLPEDTGNLCEVIWHRNNSLADERGVREVKHLFSSDILRSGGCTRLTVAITDGRWQEEEPQESCGAVVEGDHRLVVDWWIVTPDDTDTLPSVEECLSHNQRLR